MERVKKMSFRGKILCTYFLLILMTIAIFAICYIQGVKTSLTHHVDYMRQANEQKNINLDIAMGNHSSLNFLHFIDSRINVILHETVSKMTMEKRFERDSYLTKSLQMLAVINPNVRRISILTKSGDFYSSTSQNADEYVKMISGLLDDILFENFRKGRTAKS